MTIPNPEQHLLSWILHGLQFKVPPHWEKVPNPLLAVWPKAAPLKAGEVWPAGAPGTWEPKGIYLNPVPGASKNWGNLALVAKLLNGNAAQKAEADISATAWLLLQKNSAGWMMDEIMSRVYGLFGHIEPWMLMVLLGSPTVQELAGEALSIAGEIFRRTWDQATERCGWYGKRSVEPGHENRELIDDFAGWWSHGMPYPQHGGSEEGLILEAITESRASVARSHTPSVPAKWAAADKCHILTGVGKWTFFFEGRISNTNTPDIAGGSNVNGFQLAPAAPWGAHIRNHASQSKGVVTTKGVHCSYLLPYPAIDLPYPQSPTQDWIVGT